MHHYGDLYFCIPCDYHRLRNNEHKVIRFFTFIFVQLKYQVNMEVYTIVLHRIHSMGTLCTSVPNSSVTIVGLEISFIKLQHRNHPQISNIYTNITVFLPKRHRISIYGRHGGCFIANWVCQTSRHMVAFISGRSTPKKTPIFT